jgi:glycosyltransferase involved in cell wall biosynthesis
VTLARLAEDASLRARIGAANRAHARQNYDEKAMIDSYCSVYARALGRAQFP